MNKHLPVLILLVSFGSFIKGDNHREVLTETSSKCKILDSVVVANDDAEPVRAFRFGGEPEKGEDFNIIFRVSSHKDSEGSNLMVRIILEEYDTTFEFHNYENTHLTKFLFPDAFILKTPIGEISKLLVTDNEISILHENDNGTNARILRMERYFKDDWALNLTRGAYSYGMGSSIVTANCMSLDLSNFISETRRMIRLSDEKALEADEN